MYRTYLVGFLCILPSGCSGSGPTRTPQSEEAIPLAQPAAFPEEYRAAVDAVAQSLRDAGEDPKDFSATTQREGTAIVFHLWHASAFDPQNQNVTGNPGGKCRDVWYDTHRRQVVRTLFWQ